MSEFDHLFTSDAGIQWSMKTDADGNMHFKASDPNVDKLLDQNKAMANHNDGYNKARDFKRVACIPDIVALKWLHEEGWWYLDPDAKKKLHAKLNDPDWKWLRTADGRV